MPIDSRIALSGNALQIDNPLDVYAKGMQIAGAQKQNRLADLTYGQKQTEIDQSNKLARVMSSAGDPRAKDYRAKVEQGLVDAGLGQNVSAFRTQSAGEDKASLEARSAQLQNQLEIAAYVAQAVSGATPENWAVTRNDIIGTVGEGIAAKLPEAFDANANKALLAQGIPRVEQLKLDAAAAKAAADQANVAASLAERMRATNLSHADRQAAIAAGKEKASAAKQDKPLPPAIADMQNKTLEKIHIASTLIRDTDKQLKAIEGGTLALGPYQNLKNTAKNEMGASDANSLAYADFTSFLQRLNNESLRLNTGVQTDGDALRSALATLATTKDTKVAKQAFEKVQAINREAVRLHKLQADQVRAEYNKSSLDTSAYEVSTSDDDADFADAASRYPVGP